MISHWGGATVEWLESSCTTAAEGSNTVCEQNFTKTLSVYRARCPTVFRAREGEDSEGRECVSVTPLSVQDCSLTASSLHNHWLCDNLQYIFIDSGSLPVQQEPHSTGRSIMQWKPASTVGACQYSKSSTVQAFNNAVETWQYSGSLSIQ